MSSTKIKRKVKVMYQPMDAAKYDSKVINLFLPTVKIINTNGDRFKRINHYKNLSHYQFKQEEIDFVCDCYHSGKYSIMGVTNVHGERRLTITGIRDRYQLDAEVIRKWIVTYKRKLRLLKEMATDIKEQSAAACTSLSMLMKRKTIDFDLIEKVMTRIGFFDDAVLVEEEQKNKKQQQQQQLQQQTTGRPIGPLEAMWIMKSIL